MPSSGSNRKAITLPPCPCDNPESAIRAQAAALGFDACGFAAAHEVSDEARQQYARWLATGRNGCMQWAAGHQNLRSDPRLLLPGARTVIALAMNYYPQLLQPQDAPRFAFYAYGRDYHEVLRGRMRQLAAFLQQIAPGCECRPCVDTAPLRERWWAVQAGIGFIGINGQLILPGRGSYFFLGCLLTTQELKPDAPCTLSCQGCQACVRACPTAAITPGQAVDARRCLSCLTIEQRGPLPEWVASKIGNRVYGCDTCQLVCPHNRDAQPTRIPEFQPTDEFLHLTRDQILHMTPADFSRLFSHSAVKRTKLAGLQRNAHLIE